MKHATAFQDGLIAAKAGKKMLARIQFEQVTEISPDFADGWLWLAWTEDSLEASESLLQRASELSPDDELVSSFMDVVSRLKQYEYAVETADNQQLSVDEEIAAEESEAAEQETEVALLTLEDQSTEEDHSEEAASSELEAEEIEPAEFEASDDDASEYLDAQEIAAEAEEEIEPDAEHYSEQEVAVESQEEGEESTMDLVDVEVVEATTPAEAEVCCESTLDGDIVACDQEVCDPENCEAENCKRQVEPVDISEVSESQVVEQVEDTATDIAEDSVSDDTGDASQDSVLPVAAAAAVATTAAATTTVQVEEEEPESIEAEIVDEVEQLQAEVADAVKPPEEQPQANKRGKATILVVDDSPTVRKLITITLESAGYRVVTASDGVEATKELISLTPAMILTDINMPRMDGYKLCKLVKKHEKTRLIPVVMLSGKDGVFDKLRGKMVGCNDYMSKPFEAADLLKFVEQYAGGTYVDA